MNTKPWWASKTIWANLLMIASLVGATIGFPPCSPDMPPEAQCIPLGAEQQASIVAGIMGVVNLLLRLITTKPVTARKEKP